VGGGGEGGVVAKMDGGWGGRGEEKRSEGTGRGGGWVGYVRGGRGVGRSAGSREMRGVEVGGEKVG